MAPSLLLRTLLVLASAAAVVADAHDGRDDAYKPANWVSDPLPPPPLKPKAAVNTTGCQTVLQVLSAYNLTTFATAAKKAGVDLNAPGNTVFVPLESAFYRLASVGQTTAFTASALYKGSSNKYLRDLSDFVKFSIVPGAVSTRSLHDAQRLDTELGGQALEVKLPSDQDYSTILILGPYARLHAMVVRKDLPVCGGGYVQVIDGVVLPHAM